jgi:hypothetical protein
MGQIIKVQWPVSAAPIRGRIYNTLLGVLNDRCNSFNIEGSHSNCYRHYILLAVSFILIWFALIWFLVFSATYSNISAISWRPILVVEEDGVPGENHKP